MKRDMLRVVTWVVRGRTLTETRMSDVKVDYLARVFWSFRCPHSYPVEAVAVNGVDFPRS